MHTYRKCEAKQKTGNAKQCNTLQNKSHTHTITRHTKQCYNTHTNTGQTTKNKIRCNTVPCHTVPYHHTHTTYITLHHFTSHHIASQPITSHCITLHHIASHRITAYLITWDNLCIYTCPSMHHPCITHASSMHHPFKHYTRIRIFLHNTIYIYIYNFSYIMYDVQYRIYNIFLGGCMYVT